MGDSNYVLGDLATGQEVSSFKQPVHADRIVPMDGGVLDDPISETKEVIVEQRHGTIMEKAWDGRVLIEMATAQAEDDFACEFANMGAKRDDRNPGVWVDLSKHTYYFPEVFSSTTENRRGRKSIT